MAGPVKHNVHEFEQELRGLNYSGGLTKEQISQKLPNIDKSYFDKCPANQQFHSFDELWNCVKPEMTGPEAGYSPGSRPSGTS